jgi:hypothetical protein
VRASLILLALCAALALAPAAAARDYELTPLLGLRFDGDLFSPDSPLEEGPSYGLVFGIPLSDSTAFELLVSRQDSEAEIRDEVQGSTVDVDVNVDHYHFAGVYQGGSSSDRRRGFVTISAGVTRFDPPSGYDGQMELSFALGGGFRFRIGERTRARLQARWISTDTGSGDSITCRNGSCVVIRDSYVSELELSGGVTFRF